MSNTKTWIEEQEEILGLYRSGEMVSDPARLLEHSETNRDLSDKQGRLFTAARVLAKATGIEFYDKLALECEKVQLNVDNQARLHYIKVVIEMWQGKIQAKQSVIRSLL